MKIPLSSVLPINFADFPGLSDFAPVFSIDFPVSFPG